VVIGRIDRDFVEGSISPASTYTALPTSLIDQSTWPIQYTFSSTNGTVGVVDVVFGAQTTGTIPLNSQYSGLTGIAQPVDVYATATPSGQLYNVPATIHESLQYANIPLFQFAIFYNVNMEIDPGAAMTITGPVFGNQSIWEGSSVCTFASSVTAVGTNYPQVADPFANTYNGTGAPTFAGGQPVNNANSLVMPVGTNDSPAAAESILQLPPPAYAMGTAAAYSSMGQEYIANAADLVISNFVWGINTGSVPAGSNFVVYFQDNGLAAVPYDYYVVTNGTPSQTIITNYIGGLQIGVNNTNVFYAGYTWLTNVCFYDWREGWSAGAAKQVQAVQIDMGLLNTWLTNIAPNGGYVQNQAKWAHGNHFIGGIYVYTSVPLTTSQLPAVRVTDGAILPNPYNMPNPTRPYSPYGVTVATPFPIYVWKDYNSATYQGSSLGLQSTTYTLPAALMGDSVTVLSDSWQDSQTGKLPSPSSTTVNAAMLEGIVASNPNIKGSYSGGVENFLRLLESWGGTLTYNGSIVVLFYSQYATNSWQPTGNYYNAPSRNWAFDTNFKNANKLPPLTPSAKTMVRGNWYAHQ
jgi:hypothetical protein